MRSGAVKFKNNPVTLRGEEVKVGDKAKNFKALNLDLSEFDFYRDTEGKIKVISAAPSIDTPVCSIQTSRRTISLIRRNECLCVEQRLRGTCKGR